MTALAYRYGHELPRLRDDTLTVEPDVQREG